jgi:hypothetical protein
MFTTGEAAQGCGHAVRSKYEGVRMTSYDYIGTEQDRANIELLTGQPADRIILEERAGEFVATEVMVKDAEGRNHRIAAKYASAFSRLVVE